ncbi:hypothetical protein HGK34_18610, partial [Myceligenerans sp. I2]|nr:hypothetical protein [Myceligenerans indicum]
QRQMCIRDSSATEPTPDPTPSTPVRSPGPSPSPTPDRSVPSDPYEQEAPTITSFGQAAPADDPVREGGPAGLNWVWVLLAGVGAAVGGVLLMMLWRPS